MKRGITVHFSETQVKEADAVLLGYPLLKNMYKEVRVNDLAYYETVRYLEAFSFVFDIMCFVVACCGSMSHGSVVVVVCGSSSVLHGSVVVVRHGSVWW